MIFLLEAIIGCIIFTAMVVPSVYKSPLNWVFDAPPAIQDRAREMGLISGEKKGMPPSVILRKFLFSLVVVLVLSVMLVKFNHAESFWQGAVLSYGLWLVVDWYDALIIDCLWFCHSKKIRIPGTEDMDSAYKDYWFHIKMSCIGMLLGLPVSLLVGLAVPVLRSMGL